MFLKKNIIGQDVDDQLTFSVLLDWPCERRAPCKEAQRLSGAWRTKPRFVLSTGALNSERPEPKSNGFPKSSKHLTDKYIFSCLILYRCFYF